VRGVADKAGNKAQGSISWSFTVADFGASAASVHVTGLLLNVSASSLNNAALTAIKADLATLLGVADTRFTNLEISDAWIGGVAMSALEFTITASASKTATSLAQQLAETVQILAAGSNALSSYSSALKIAVSSQVYRLDWLLCVTDTLSTLCVGARGCGLTCHSIAPRELCLQWRSSCSWTYRKWLVS
jgi:hypothetical protein